MQLDYYHCAVCVEHLDEDIMHLFFRCPFSQARWLFLDNHWDTSLDFPTMLLRAKGNLVWCF